MAIGWAHVGVVWSEPIMIVYVRPSRHSYTVLEQMRQFTVNTATKDMAKVVGMCGTVSGRDEDKIAAGNLTAVSAKKVKPPVIEECILHYECNVLHYHDMVMENMHRKVIDSKYPEGDFHRVYYGKIVACYGDIEKIEAGS
ncbi:MAG: flavin reductase family protein [Planctomycetes bacterium]|nr:flavin reductase family protein [Planctomycetota bacterium]